MGKGSDPLEITRYGPSETARLSTMPEGGDLGGKSQFDRRKNGESITYG
jgi:hypothetical protein